MSSTNELRTSDVGGDTIRYLLFVSGRWRWRPTMAMRAHGFKLITFGKELTAADKLRAIALNDEWDRVRRGFQIAATQETIYPPGSIGDGYLRAMKLRDTERKAKGIIRTKEQEKRDDWPRAWKWLGPVYADRDPQAATPESLLALRTKVAARISTTEAHRTIKVWRALWKKLQTFGYCSADLKDPSLAFSNTAPDPRQELWQHSEVLRLVQRAWRLGYKGLAAAMAVGWDTMLSPVDIRRLNAGQMAREGRGAIFFLDRAKTGRAAAGTLSQWSEALLTAYLKSLGAELHDSAPIFRTAGSVPGPKGGRRWLPRPYSTSKMDRDFRVVRTAVFGKDELRQFADMRRSGAVEADAGGASGPDLSNKMANTIGASNRLRKTYTPVNIASVRRVDQAREVGRSKIAQEQKPTKSVITD